MRSTLQGRNKKTKKMQGKMNVELLVSLVSENNFMTICMICVNTCSSSEWKASVRSIRLLSTTLCTGVFLFYIKRHLMSGNEFACSLGSSSAKIAWVWTQKTRWKTLTNNVRRYSSRCVRALRCRHETVFNWWVEIWKMIHVKSGLHSLSIKCMMWALRHKCVLLGTKNIAVWYEWKHNVAFGPIRHNFSFDLTNQLVIRLRNNHRAPHPIHILCAVCLWMTPGPWFQGNQSDNTGFIAQRNAGRSTLTSFLLRKDTLCHRKWTLL